MVSLIADFLKETVLYDPLANLSGGAVRESSKETRKAMGFRPGWDESIHQKNLFSRDRGYVPPPPPPPPVAAQEPPPPPPPPRPEFTLKGVVMEDGRQVAIVESAKQGTYAVRVGDVVENAELLSIEDKKVVFRWLGENIVLSMEKVRTLHRR